ncbi:hypothetical protein U1Q18_017922 [Sarracenia purpurea var. burkii]
MVEFMDLRSMTPDHMRSLKVVRSVRSILVSEDLLKRYPVFILWKLATASGILDSSHPGDEDAFELWWAYLRHWIDGEHLVAGDFGPEDKKPALPADLESDYRVCILPGLKVFHKIVD